MPMVKRFPIFGDLDADWRRFVRSPEAAGAVARWKAVEPRLADLHTVADVMVLRRDPERADQVLRALVERARSDAAAARVVLQALIPGLVRISSWYADDDPESTAGEVVAIAWERICTYPAHRCGAVAPNLLFDIRKQIRTDREQQVAVPAPAPARSAEDMAIEAMVFDELRDLERSTMGDEDCFDLIVASRVMGHTLVDIAEAQGDRPHNLLMRRRRGERRLRGYLDAA